MLLGRTNLAYVAIPCQHVLPENWRRSRARHLMGTKVQLQRATCAGMCWAQHPLRVFVLVFTCPAWFSYLLPSWSLTFSNPLACPPLLFHSHHQMRWPPLFCCLLVFSFWPSFPAVSDLRSHLCCSHLLHPPYRYLSPLLQPARLSPPSKPRARCASKNFVFPNCEVLLRALVPPQTSQSVPHLSPAPVPPSAAPCHLLLPPTFPPPTTEAQEDPAWVLPDASTCSIPVLPPWTCSVDRSPLLSSQKGRTDRAGRDGRTEGSGKKRFLHSSLFCWVSPPFCWVSPKAGYRFRLQYAASSSRSRNR